MHRSRCRLSRENLDSAITQLARRDITPVIPPKANRKTPRTCDFALYRVAISSSESSTNSSTSAPSPHATTNSPEISSPVSSSPALSSCLTEDSPFLEATSGERAGVLDERQPTGNYATAAPGRARTQELRQIGRTCGAQNGKPQLVVLYPHSTPIPHAPMCYVLNLHGVILRLQSVFESQEPYCQGAGREIRR
jgi:hypothetical protein